MIIKSKNNKLFILIMIIFLSFCWYISDIPIGYYQFKKTCKNEGNLQVYSKIESNAGWIADSQSDAEAIVQAYPRVSFARFLAADGKWMDIKYKGGFGSFSKFDIYSANEHKTPRYKRTEYISLVKNSIRLHKNTIVATDVISNKIAFQSTRFIFTWTNPENTLLGRSDSVVCPSYQEEFNSIKSLFN